MIGDDSRGDPVLVTGARGLVGHTVVRQLARRGVPVLAVTRTPFESSDPMVASEVIDLVSAGSARVDMLPPLSAVVHCAAELPTSHAGEAAQAVAEANSSIDRTVVAMCRDRALRLVCVSSASVYGDTGPVPVREGAVLRPPGPYAAAKRATEERVADVLDSFCVLRPTAIYGPGQRHMTVLRHFLENALAGRPVTYHGSGGREQDFVHAEDVASACVAALSASNERSVLNVCSGEPVTMRELAGLALESAPGSGSRVSSSGLPDAQEGSRARYDRGLAKDILGWEPRIALSEGMRAWCSQLETVSPG